MRLPLRLGLTLAAPLLGVLAGLWLLVQGAAETEYRRQHDLRLQFRLQTLRAEIENRISYGLALTEIPGIQEVIEGLRRTDPEILAVDVFTPDGAARFSTDRGLIGDAVPTDWLRRASVASADNDATAGVWQARGAGSEVAGLAIRNDLHEAVGFVAMTTGGAAVPQAPAVDLWRGFAPVAAVAAALALLLGGLIGFWSERRMRHFLGGLDGAADGRAGGGAAAAGRRARDRIGAAAQELDQVSQRLAGADDTTV